MEALFFFLVIAGWMVFMTWMLIAAGRRRYEEATAAWEWLEEFRDENSEEAEELREYFER